MGFGFLLGLFGGVLLAHAAYSTVQYRGMLKIMEEEYSGPPLNIAVELLIGLGMCIWAGLALPDKFRSILPDSEENRQGPPFLADSISDKRIRLIVSLPTNLDFMIFNHRGGALPPNLELKLKKA